MKYDKDFFKDKVLIIREQGQLDKLLNDFECNKSEIDVKEFPMIVYEGRFKGIDISEISIGGLTQLKYDIDFSRSVVEFEI